MGLKVTNNAFGTLNAGINSSATTIVLTAGQGARFPTLSAGDYFYATLIDTSNNLEIVKVTARSTDTMTVVRGQDNTTARAYSTNDRFELRPTAALFNEKANANEYLPLTGGTVSGNLQIAVGGVAFTSSDVNGYPRFTQSSGSAQLGLFRSNTTVGGGYIGADGDNCLDVRTATFDTRLKVDQSGRVITPQQPVFSVRLSSNQTVNSGIALLDFSSVDINIGSHFNTSTKRFTAPVAGKYFLNLRMYCNPASGSYIGLYITGSPGTRYAFSPVGNDVSTDLTWIVNMAANDYVEAYYYNSGTHTARPDGTAFEGFLIG
jgi:hypothetical protein